MLISSLLFLLFLGIGILSLVPSTKTLLLRQIALGITSVVFVLSLLLWVGFDQSTPKFQFVVDTLWLPVGNINIILGIDGISLFFVLLTTLIFPICLLASWASVTQSLKSYLISFLSMELILILVFTSLDLIFFYICFETILIPMF